MLEKIKKDCLIFDIETYSRDYNGKDIDLKKDPDEYIARAKVRFVGCYSYKTEKYYQFFMDEKNASTDFINLFNNHKYIVGFNNNRFDNLIIDNSYDRIEFRNKISVDVMEVLGSAKYIGHRGVPFKDRGKLMGVKLTNNSLRAMASAFNVETQKEQINYMIFGNTSFKKEELFLIAKYLKADVFATKQLFDKIFDFWAPFTKLLSEKNIYNLSWIRSSIASLVYKCACHTIGVTDTYEDISYEPEEVGGLVLEPKVHEESDVYLLDFASLYPNIMTMFNIFAPAESKDAYETSWKMKNRYSKKVHPLCEQIQKMNAKRQELKIIDPKNEMIYPYKIFMNTIYGVIRSPKFSQLYVKYGGQDICNIGQQFLRTAVEKFEKLDFNVLYGDTDSVFVKAKDSKNNSEETVKNIANLITQEILNKSPFPTSTFLLDVKQKFDYVMFNHEVDKKRNIIPKKKSYITLSKGDVDINGLTIIKENRTRLGDKILKERIIPHIRKNKSAFIDKQIFFQDIRRLLAENIGYAAVKYNVKPLKTYTNENSIYAQISRHFFNGNGGSIELIKNEYIGAIGKK